MYSAVEVTDFVVDRHLHHGCVVEQCIRVKRGRDVIKSRTVVTLSWERDTFGGLLITFLMRFIFLFLFFSLLSGSTFVVSLSVKHVINLVWPNGQSDCSIRTCNIAMI